ncbi:ferric reductase-like transmembrane domain-containing protein [Leptospira sp. 201903070]|uniref:Ferric reductase-like transmembrane domain-containing protein n=1 Tax=Leptospira ainlahdjerensis TaxID=2810033 RepID=A0ABS2U5P8_9LEPT|nr:ferredoxin reductase family protein [Leptospira ainlahdjerensis]MBM9575701.1 ferric reductase-like transmembrane domain-containing protein [Leptospira ainlahdjerensis]
MEFLEIYLPIIGLLLFSCTFFLALKLKKLSAWSTGIASQYRLHHWFGIFTTFFIFAHILFETVSFPEILTMLDEPAVLTGWIAFLIYSLSILFAFWKLQRYRSWFVIHLFLIPSYFLAIIHGYLFLSEEWWHRIPFVFSVTLGAGSILAILLRTWSGTLWKIQKIDRISDSSVELDLIPDSDKDVIREEYKAGAILYLRFLGKEYSHDWHPFSIGSCSESDLLRLRIKNLGKDTKRLINALPGDRIEVLGPFQELNVDWQKDQIWIAGGIGIAPFLGRARCLQFRASGKIRLTYFFSDPKDLSVQSELDEISKKFSQFQWRFVEVPQKQHPDLSILNSDLYQNEDAEYLICGPPQFMKNVRRYLHSQAVPNKRIHSEEFSPW